MEHEQNGALGWGAAAGSGGGGAADPGPAAAVATAVQALTRAGDHALTQAGAGWAAIGLGAQLTAATAADLLPADGHGGASGADDDGAGVGAAAVSALLQRAHEALMAYPIEVFPAGTSAVVVEVAELVHLASGQRDG